MLYAVLNSAGICFYGIDATIVLAHRLLLISRGILKFEMYLKCLDGKT